MAGNPSGQIGSDLYNQLVNDRIKELDMRFALNNSMTPLVNDFSGLRGGTRPRSHIMSGNSSSRYPIFYPESLAVTAGARRGRPRSTMVGGAHNIDHSLMYRQELNMLQPTNNSYPSVIPLKHPISRRKPKGAGRKKGMHSLTHPHELDYTTKKSSKVHHIQGRYVRSMPRPFVAGKRHPPSLKDIGNALKPSNIKKSFQKLGSTIKQDYRKTSPTFKKYARAVIPAATGFLGASLGGLVGEVGGPLGSAVGATLGGMGGKDVGDIINKKIGLGRKPRTKAPSHRSQLVRQIMHEYNMTLPQASKYIKDHGLY